MGKKKKSIQEVTAVTEPLAIEESHANNIRANLEEIKTYDDVIGYILRNSTSAAFLGGFVQLLLWLLVRGMGWHLKWLDQLGDTEGLNYLVVESDGVPERVLFKLS